MSQNMRGLNDPMVIQRLWNYYKDLLLNLKIVLLQEHKWWGEKEKKLWSQLWKELKMLVTFLKMVI